LPEAEPERRGLRLDDLARSVENPARTLLRERLGLQLVEADELPVPREPFAPDALEGYALRAATLQGRLAGHDLERTRALLRARGVLPHGTAGDVVVGRAALDIEPIARQVEVHLPLPVPLAVHLRIGDFLVTGTLDGVGAGGRLSWRAGRIRPADRLRLWVRHLVLQVLAPPGVERASRLVALDGTIALLPLADAVAEDALRALLELYWEALHRLLPLFPEAGYEFARRGEGETGLRAARAKYETSHHHRGDGADRWVAYAWRGVDPIGEEFARLASAVWKPVLAAEVKA